MKVFELSEGLLIKFCIARLQMEPLTVRGNEIYDQILFFKGKCLNLKFGFAAVN